MGVLVAVITLLGTALSHQGSLAQGTAAPPSDPAHTRAAFLQMIDRPRVPLAPEVQALPDTEGLAHVHFTFAAEAAQRVPGILLKLAASEGRRPVVVVLHGTGLRKESQLPLLKTLAGRGFVAVAIDGRYHGERLQTGPGAIGYAEAILQRYRAGHGYPFLYDTVWDVLRLTDYLETREDVDATRIGVIGISKGGTETYLAAAVESRIAVAVPMIAVRSLRWTLEHQTWPTQVELFQAAIDGAARDAGVLEVDAAFVRTFYDRVAPGIYTQFDGPAMVPLIAPRPLLVINGDSDARNPLPAVMECAAAAEQAYRNAGAEDKFVLHLQKNTGHATTAAMRQAAVEWMVKWLKP